MITASVRIRLPEGFWVADVSQSFPNATFRLLSGVRTGETAIELGEIRGDEPKAAADAVSAHSSIIDYEQLEVTEDRSLAKYETTDTEMYAFIEQSELPPEFPIEVRDGWYRLDFTGTREEFDRLRVGLETAGVPYELRSLVEANESDGLLTPRQKEVLEAAVREGYFEVPRECSLDELASTLDIDKSTASTILRRGESRILKWFLTGSHQDRLGN